MLDAMGFESQEAFSIAAAVYPPKMQAAMQHLWEAIQYARASACDPWEFAVEAEDLRRLGLTTSDLRWLVKQGYVEHACEVTEPCDVLRRFLPHQNVSLTGRTCFVLTAAGVRSVESLAAAVAISGSISDRQSFSRLPDEADLDRPDWDHQCRVLSFSGRVVKRFRRPSPNQERIFAAFQEEGWPRWIADPLSPHPELDPKRRLHETIRSMNKCQQNRLLRFRGDGTGEGVFWEAIAGAANGADCRPRPVSAALGGSPIGVGPVLAAHSRKAA